MFDLTGRTALVTGAGQGVGAGIASVLAAQGATVVVNDLERERAAVTAEMIAGEGARSVTAAFDVTDLDAVQEGLRAAVEEVGPIDVLVNNAGVPPTMALTPFLETGPDEWRPYLDLNLYGSMHCIRELAPAMVERGWGRIVQISSGAGRTGIGLGIAVYGASKSGIEGLVRHLAVELGPHGVTVNAIALGMMDNVPEEVVPSLARQVPVRRLGRPEEVGAAVAYVASEEAGWLTGHTIQLNGGAIIV